MDKKLLAGEKNFEKRLDNAAKNFLKTTYLKPLRDASNELKPGFRSRLAQILNAHPAFENSIGNSEHELVVAMQEANEKVENFFDEPYDTEGNSIVKDIEGLLSDFYDSSEQSKAKSNFTITKNDLASILKRLSLDTEDTNLGLGNLNLLFIATELLLLNNSSARNSVIGPQITLIEEVEAHLHTQAQIRLIKYLEDELDRRKNQSQFIITSHSSNLVASMDPKNIILINNNVAYPFLEKYTKLSTIDFDFLERFLDSTKSNLFFSKGLIFVEGDSEMLLLPALANLIGYPLHKYGISLVNVNGTSFERYVRLFSRSDFWREELNQPTIKIPLSIITDVDIKPLAYYDIENKEKSIFLIEDDEELDDVIKYCEEKKEDINVQNIGNDYPTLKSLAKNLGFELNDSNTEQIKSITSKTLTEDVILRRKNKKIFKEDEKYEGYDANLEVFLAPEWTLEYTLALSVIAPLLVESIHEIRYQEPYIGKRKDSYDSLILRLDDRTECEKSVAYDIFKPLNDKLVSKAEVAQLLAIKINKIYKSDKKIEWREKIIEDENLEYIINAIKHCSRMADYLEGGTNE